VGKGFTKMAEGLLPAPGQGPLLLGRRRLLVAMAALTLLTGVPETRAAEVVTPTKVSILLYHRFGPTVPNTMTVTTTDFEGQLKSIKSLGYTVVPLKDLVRKLKGESVVLPERAVVLTADDGHRSVYTDMFPLIQRYQVPVTLFIYPSAISNAPYALTWQQLAEMKKSGLVDVQSHTYWHPNFRVERKRLSADAFEKFLRKQLVFSKQALEGHLGGTVDLLAWPYGIYDPELMAAAAKAGYVAAFSIDRRPATAAEPIMALPRYIVSDHDRGPAFARLLTGPIDMKQVSEY
jgi:peptidoglycan/xylan/chitin deacetylase (PgdA/CDA1 family)